MNSLLPPNATPQERALAEAVARVSDVPVPGRTLYDADTLQSALLPWLAWAFSLDEWNPNWTDAQKRQAIQNSLYVHGHKGTASALKRAMDALGITVYVLEWFQRVPAGDPYTFGLLLEIDNVGIPDAAGWRSIEAIALGAKNVRSHMSGIDAVALSRANLYCASRYVVGETVFVDLDEDSPLFHEIYLRGFTEGFTEVEAAVDELHNFVNVTMPAAAWW